MKTGRLESAINSIQCTISFGEWKPDDLNYERNTIEPLNWINNFYRSLRIMERIPVLACIKSLDENINKNKPWKKNQNVYVFQDCKKEKSTIEIQNS